MIELTLLKELILIKQMYQNSVIFVTIDIFKIKSLNFNHMFAVAVMTY